MTAGPPTERVKVTVSVLFLMSMLLPPEVSKSCRVMVLVVPPPLKMRSGSWVSAESTNTLRAAGGLELPEKEVAPPLKLISVPQGRLLLHIIDLAHPRGACHCQTGNIEGAA